MYLKLLIQGKQKINSVSEPIISLEVSGSRTARERNESCNNIKGLLKVCLRSRWVTLHMTYVMQEADGTYQPWKKNGVQRANQSKKADKSAKPLGLTLFSGGIRTEEPGGLQSMRSLRVGND